VIVFRTARAPSFARCSCGCGSSLAGLRCWSWLERDGSPAYGSIGCVFPERALRISVT